MKEPAVEAKSVTKNPAAETSGNQKTALKEPTLLLMPVAKVMPVYFASFSTDNLKSLNGPGKRKDSLLEHCRPPVTTSGAAGAAASVEPAPSQAILTSSGEYYKY